MNRLELEANYIPHIRDQVATGTAVLFLGAGFSLAAQNRHAEPIPNAPTLINSIWSLCYPGEPLEEGTLLPDIFETAQSYHAKELTLLLKRTFTVDPDSCPPWYESLLSLPWLRIYTLNIDDLVEQVLSTNQAVRAINSVSATTSTTPVFNDSKLTIIHLNGKLDDLPDNVTFSRSQYAQRTIIDEPAYIQLKNDLLFRSVFFVGSSLDEAPLWQHMEMRGNKPQRGHREIRRRSYLVIPSINRSKQALLTRYNVAHLPFTAEQFEVDILGTLTDERLKGHLALAGRVGNSASSMDHFHYVSELAPRDKASEEYLMGAKPTWADVITEKIAHRECFDSLWNEINSIRASNTPQRFIVLTGTAGTGKSSALMAVAMLLEADGIPVAWLDSTSIYSLPNFRKALSNSSSLKALFIDDADLYDNRLSQMVRDVLASNPRTIIVCETRSTKVDRIVKRSILVEIQSKEFTVPSLVDSDITAILDVLDREHRLGELKGKTREERERVFRGLAGRQLLVAMHMATFGKEFPVRVHNELKEMTGLTQFIYGLVCVASAHRFELRQEDIGIACGDNGTEWLPILDALVRRKLILPRSNDAFAARHRVIGQFVYDALTQDGSLHEIVHALIRIGATKTTPNTPYTSQPARLLRSFTGHDFMKRSVGIERARIIYSDYEDALSWNHHFWLHRGALELEMGDLDKAENFLKQAKSINPRDVFIDNEIAYLSFKRAISNPQEMQSRLYVEDAIETLKEIAVSRPDQMAHAFHIMGSQGLEWANVGIESVEDKKEFLDGILRRVKRAQRFESSEMMESLEQDIARAILSLAIQRNKDT